MQNVYFQALENVLKDGCFIKVFLSGMRYPVIRVEKPNPEGGENILVAYTENGSVIGGLFSIASALMPADAEIPEVNEIIDIEGICREVSLRGYTLHIMMLPTGKFLSMVCTNGRPNYLPLKTTIGDTVQESLELLNELMIEFDFDSCEFMRFADDQSEVIRNYYRKKREAAENEEEK